MDVIGITHPIFGEFFLNERIKECKKMSKKTEISKVIATLQEQLSDAQKQLEECNSNEPKTLRQMMESGELCDGMLAMIPEGYGLVYITGCTSYIDAHKAISGCVAIYLPIDDGCEGICSMHDEVPTKVWPSLDAWIADQNRGKTIHRQVLVRNTLHENWQERELWGIKAGSRDYELPFMCGTDAGATGHFRYMKELDEA